MLSLDQVVSAADAAEQLGVSSHEVRRLLQDGSLVGQRVAGRWFVSTVELRRFESLDRLSGRPYSPRSCWALLQMIEGRSLSVSASRAWQLRQYLDRDPTVLAARMRGRANRVLGHVHSSLLPQLHDDAAVLRAGVSAADDVGADLLVRDELLELYIAADQLDRVVAGYSLRRSPGQANVVAHVVPAGIALPFDGVAPRSLVALDLIESGEPRAIDAGRRLWRAAIRDTPS